jgi:hypothetical protein
MKAKELTLNNPKELALEGNWRGWIRTDIS